MKNRIHGRIQNVVNRPKQPVESWLDNVWFYAVELALHALYALVGIVLILSAVIGTVYLLF